MLQCHYQDRADILGWYSQKNDVPFHCLFNSMCISKTFSLESLPYDYISSLGSEDGCSLCVFDTYFKLLLSSLLSL